MLQGLSLALRFVFACVGRGLSATEHHELRRSWQKISQDEFGLQQLQILLDISRLMLTSF